MFFFSVSLFFKLHSSSAMKTSPPNVTLSDNPFPACPVLGYSRTSWHLQSVCLHLLSDIKPLPLVLQKKIYIYKNISPNLGYSTPLLFKYSKHKLICRRAFMLPNLRSPGSQRADGTRCPLAVRSCPHCSPLCTSHLAVMMQDGTFTWQVSHLFHA